MKLHQAFNVIKGDVVAFVGAGGKTSALIGLGYELAEQGWRVLATTTTYIEQDQLELIPDKLKTDANNNEISQRLTEKRFVFLYDRIQQGKVYGADPVQISYLMDAVDSDVMLIEADKSNGMPLKAPYEDEPNIPSEASLVVPVASMAALGATMDDEHLYNAKAMIDRYGFPEGNRVKSPWMAQVLRDEELGLRGIPQNARVVVFLNRASYKGYNRARARLVARLALRKSRLHGVAIGSVRGTEPVHEIQRPVGAVVMAAGLSTRMGEPKVLLPWVNGNSIIQHIVEQLLNSRLEHVVVVTGHMAKEVRQQVEPMGVKVVYNRSYKTGEMLSSVKAGLRAMPDHVAAALLVLGDQPRLQPKVIYQVMAAYAEGKGDLIIPSFEMRRGHPILLGRRYWPEMLALRRDGAPRQVINAHADQIHYVNVDTDSVLRDVDTPEDYSNERWRAGLS